MQGPLQQQQGISGQKPKLNSKPSQQNEISRVTTIESQCCSGDSSSTLLDNYQNINYLKFQQLEMNEQIKQILIIASSISQAVAQKSSKKISQLVNIFVGIVTMTNHQRYSTDNDKINQIQKWKYTKMSTATLETVSSSIQLIIEQVDFNNFDQVIMLFYLMIRFNLQTNDKIMSIVYQYIKKYIYQVHIQQFGKINKFLRLLGICLINHIFKQNYVSQLMLKIYATAFCLVLNNMTYKDQIQELQSHFVNLPLIYSLTQGERNEKNGHWQTKFVQQKQSLFYSLSIVYIKTGSQMILNSIKHIISSELTSNMVNNIWNLLNSDNIKKYSSFDLDRLQQILFFMKQSSKQNKKFCILSKNNGQFKKSIQKKPSLFIIKCQIRHPRTLATKNGNILLSFQTQNGQIVITVQLDSQTSQKYAIYVKKLNIKNQSTQAGRLKLFQIQSCLIQFTIQFKSNKMAQIYYCQNDQSKCIQISNSFFQQRIKLVSNKTKRSTTEFENVIYKIFAMHVFQDIQYHQYEKIKDTLKKSTRKQANGLKNRLIRKLNSIDGDKEVQGFNLIQFVKQRAYSNDKQQKLTHKSIFIREIQILTQKSYSQILIQINGKAKIPSYILTALQNINDDKIMQNLLNIFKKQWELSSSGQEQLNEIRFLYGFGLFKNISAESADKILNLVDLSFPQDKKFERITQKLKYKINYYLQSKSNQQQIQNVLSIIQQYFKQKITQKNESFVNRLLTLFNFSLWSCINDYAIASYSQVKEKEYIVSLKKSLDEKNYNYVTKNDQKQNKVDLQKIGSFGELIYKSIAKLLENSQNIIILEFLQKHLELLIIILTNISINQNKFDKQVLLIILQTNLNILQMFSMKLAKISAIQEADQTKICNLLSQVFNLLPALCLYSTAVQKQAKQDKKERDFYDVYTSSHKCNKTLSQDKYYLLMSNYYYTCFLVGTCVTKSKSIGCLYYMMQAHKFIKINKEYLFWDEKQDTITIKDRIFITQLYACCWKFICDQCSQQKKDNFHFFHLDIQTIREVIHELNELGLPIYYVKSKNKKDKCTIEQIIRFYLYSGVNEQIPSNVLANINSENLKRVFQNALRQSGSKMPPKNHDRINREIIIMAAINACSKPINIQLPDDSSYQSESRYADYRRIVEWYQIYNKIKFLHLMVSEREQYNIVKQLQYIHERILKNKQFNNLQYLLQNFLNNSSNQHKELINQKECNLMFIQLLLNQCKQINHKIKMKMNDKNQLIKNRTFDVSVKQSGTYFHTERTQIMQNDEDSQKLDIKLIKSRMFNKIMKFHRNYFTEMYYSLALNKNNDLFAYYRMIQKLLIQNKINRAKTHNKYSQFENYILDDWLTSQNVKVMLKRDPESILRNLINKQIPKLNKNKQDYFHTAFAIKIAHKLLNLNKNPFFQIPNQVTINSKTKKKGNLVISVYLVTKSKIYQGKAKLTSTSICFTENNFIDKQAYQKLYATNPQERTYQEIAVSRKSIEIQINQIKYSQKKKYLHKFPSLQLFASNLSYFFVFSDQQTRDRLILQANIENRKRQQHFQLINQIKHQWDKGILSNFELIVKVNNIAGRSFNDVSQYYVFPWTVTNFKDIMSIQFLTNQNNFRDLSKPIGAQNNQKLMIIKNNYRSGINQSSFFEECPHLYGSFYSNPGVVCNYLLRVNPFTTHHYQLQGNRFDLYDRLFINMDDQYRSIYTSFSDNRELVPEFYCAPQFFRNRNQYNFSQSKNSDQIDLPFIMPKWVLSNSPEEFIFRMRKALQSQVTSTKLGSWLDLIFGFKSQYDIANKYDNLYVAELYNKNIKEVELTKQKIQHKAHMIKQFGQVPQNIFGKNTALKPLHNKLPQSIFQLSPQHQKVIQLTDNNDTDLQKYSVVFDFCQCILAISQKNKLLIMNTNQEITKLEISTEVQLKSLSIMVIKKSNNIIVFGVNIHGNAVAYAIKKGFKASLFISSTMMYKNEQYIKLFQFHKFNLVKTISNYAVFTQSNKLKIIEVDKTSKQKTICSLFEKEMHLNYGKSISIHQSPITILQTSQTLSLGVSIDTNNLVNVFGFTPNFNIRSIFSLTTLKAYQKVKKIIIHSMGTIVILTNLNSLLVYNIYGDFIKKIKLMMKASISGLAFWDFFNSSDVILSTIKGYTYKFNIFDVTQSTDLSFYQKQKKKVGKNQNNGIIMHRLGRLWQTYFVESIQRVIVIQCQKQFTQIYQSHKFKQNCNLNNTYRNS